MLGGTVGTLAHRLFLAYTATPGAYALVGIGVRWHRARSHDVSADDFRDDTGLCGHRPVDDFEPGQSFHFFATAEAADLRSPCNTGWNTSAVVRVAPAECPAAGNSSDALCDRVAASRGHGAGSSVSLWVRWFFRTSTPTKGLTWH